MSKSFVELSFLLFCVLTYIAILEFFLRRRNGVKFLDEKTVLLHVILIILSGILSAYQGIVIGFIFLSFSSLLLMTFKKNLFSHHFSKKSAIFYDSFYLLLLIFTERGKQSVLEKLKMMDISSEVKKAFLMSNHSLEDSLSFLLSKYESFKPIYQMDRSFVRDFFKFRNRKVKSKINLLFNFLDLGTLVLLIGGYFVI
ncbi:MAG TPA: hypothetical protein DEP20_00420 [Fusobacteria bacterium]|nr:hypothetical protein [Fusobacteriota bacterium]